MQKTRILALILSVLVLVPVTACSRDASTGDTSTESVPETESATETEPVYTLDLPDIDRGGDTFTIIAGTHMAEKTLTFGDVEDDGDILNTALYKRNLALKELFNIDIDQVQTADSDIVNGTTFKKMVDAGESFGIGIIHDRYATAAALDNYLTPIDRLQYVDLSKPWWYQNSSKELSLGNRVLWTFGYYDLTSIDSLIVMVYNKRITDDYNLENIYDLVRAGTWTVNKFEEMCKATQADINGDNKMDENDRWGMSAYPAYWYLGFAAVNGETYVVKDENDLPKLNSTNNERLVDVFNKMLELDNDELIFFSTNNSLYTSLSEQENTAAYFTGGYSTFCPIALSVMPVLRDMDDDFGIIPFPLYEEVDAGTPYSGFVMGGFPYHVPSSCADPDFSSAFLEAAAYYSYEYVMPEYYNKVLLVKQTRDEDSAEMLEMMDKNRVMDMTKTHWLDNVWAMVESAIKSGDLVSAMATYESKLDEFFSNIAEKVAELN